MKTFQRIRSTTTAHIPEDWLKIKTIDMHTGGEPLRVIVNGYPELAGSNVLEYRRYCSEHLDHLRTSLMFEPRGHADMYGCLLVPPNDASADFGVIFMHNEGYSTMCGHAIIALSKLAVHQNWIKVHEGLNTIRIDAPCGRVESHVQVKNGQVEEIDFHGVPSFVVTLDQEVEVDSIGRIRYDIAYGGAFYAYVDLAKNNLELSLDARSADRIILAGREIKQAVIDQGANFHHPFEPDLSFLYGTIFVGEALSDQADNRNVCVFADGEVDRSPTGSGVSGRMAIHHARGELQVGDEMIIESIIGTTFNGSVLQTTDYGPFNAVIPKVTGSAYITGEHTFLIDPADPLKYGFILR